MNEHIKDDLSAFVKTRKFVENDPTGGLYMDGTIAAEIEHMLVMRLHPLNTIQEIETLKYRIHQMMIDAYWEGQGREKDG